NLKQGHCVRYAAALALMLRSLGIPARVVKGYRGGEVQEDGVYFVRQSQAHSWVEALVPEAEGRPDGEGPAVWQWLTLEPTPPLPSDQARGFSWARWFGDAWRSGEALWKGFILEYNADQQGQSVAELWARLAGGRGLRVLGSVLGVAVLGVAALLAVPGGARLARRLWPRRGEGPARPRPPGGAVYAPLLAALAHPRPPPPRPGRTPPRVPTA